MIKRKAPLLEQKSTPTSLISSLLTIAFFAGLFLNIWEIHIYHHTIIHWLIPTLIWLCTGLVFWPFTSAYLTKYYDSENPFMQIFINVVAFGGILVFCFMALNYYFDYDNRIEIIKAPITSIGHLASGRHGCEQPYAEVILKDNEKQILFPCDSNLENFKFIKFTLRKGLFGFDIILAQTPSTD